MNNSANNPSIDPSVYIAEGAIVRGDVTIAADCSIWFNAVIRADSAPIEIGYGSNIQDNAVLHVDGGKVPYGVHIGEYVTVGHGAIVHGCTVGSNTIVGMGAIILNGASVGQNCIIGAGALVPQNKIIPDNSLVMGVPGKIIRSVTPAEIQSNHDNAAHYIAEGHSYKENEPCIVAKKEALGGMNV